MGDWEIIQSGLKQVLIMCYSWEGHSLLFLHNFDEKPLEVMLIEKQTGEKSLIDLLKNNESIADENGIHTIILEAYGYRWFRAGNLEHLFSKNK